MSNELISIIVPVYNAEKYLDRCVESIVNQTYTNLEIILIDDGSPDNCPKMCDKWAKKDSRIKVIHKENGGAASARNAGLEVVTGNYIGFVDSDDYIDENMYKALYNSIKEKQSDIAMCSYYNVDNFGNIKSADIPTTNEFIDKYDLINSKSSSCFGVVLWNCLYKSDLWNDIRFPDYKKYEDAAVLPYVFYNADKISFVQEPLYYYVFVDGSIMHTRFSEKDLVLIDIYEKKLEFFKNNSHYDETFNSALLMLRFFLMLNCNENTAEYKQLKNYAKTLLKRAKKEKVKFTRKGLLSYIVCFTSPKLYLKLLKFI